MKNHITLKEEIEKELLKNNWTIIFPEKINCMGYQLDLYEHADFIAGTESSAFHVIMGVNNPKLKVILLSKVMSDIEDYIQVNLDIQFAKLNTKIETIKCLEVTGTKWGSSKDISLVKGYSSKSISEIINGHTK